MKLICLEINLLIAVSLYDFVHPFNETVVTSVIPLATFTRNISRNEHNGLRRRRQLLSTIPGWSDAPGPALEHEQPMPFLVLFTDSVGSSWLMNELSIHPTVCTLGIEPLDDYCGHAGKSSGNAKRQLGWLRVAMSPPSVQVFSEHAGRRLWRGEAWKAAWRRWKVKLVQHSLPCRIEELKKSIDGDRCDSTYVRAFGFKTRLFAGGMLGHKPKGPK